MISKKKKKEIIQDLLDNIKRAKAIYLSKFQGITVSQANDLRSQLREKEGLAKVAKKNLIDIALRRSNYNLGVRNKYSGSLILSFAFDDPLAVAKIIWNFSKKNKTFQILEGIVEQQIVEKEKIQQLAQIPSRDVLLGQVVGAIASPIRGLNYVLEGNILKLVYALSAIQRTQSQH